MKNYKKPELKERALRRAALVLYEQWEEFGGGDTRILDHWMIPNQYVEVGSSLKGKGYREHVVPRKVIRDECLTVFEDTLDQDKELVIDKAAKLIGELLYIIHITKEEANHVDIVQGLKQKMPQGWKYEDGDVFARLKKASIEFELDRNSYTSDDEWKRLKSML